MDITCHIYVQSFCLSDVLLYQVHSVPLTGPFTIIPYKKPSLAHCSFTTYGLQFPRITSKTCEVKIRSSGNIHTCSTSRPVLKLFWPLPSSPNHHAQPSIHHIRIPDPLQLARFYCIFPHGTRSSRFLRQRSFVHSHFHRRRLCAANADPRSRHPTPRFRTSTLNMATHNATRGSAPKSAKQTTVR